MNPQWPSFLSYRIRKTEAGNPLPAVLMMLLALLLSAAGVKAQNGIDFDAKRISIALSTEPPSLNTLRATDNISFQVLEHLQEGLLRIGPSGELMPGMAQSWDLSGDQALFYLRPDALWSDGVPVTAHDFVFAWQRVVDPVTASPYASILYAVRNAEAINNGSLPATALGVSARDDHTLVVELEQPTAYFLQLMPFVTFFPVREDFYQAQAQRYAADTDNMIFNGPYKLAQWVHGASLRLEKNPLYWNRDAVAIKVIDIPYITPDQNAVFNLFRNGSLAMVSSLDRQSLDSAIDNRMRIRSTPGNALVFQSLNHRAGRLTANLNFRRALQAAYDNEELVYKVLGIPGTIPGISLFPSYLRGVSDRFRVEYPLKAPAFDPAQAQLWLALARTEMAVEQWPTLVLLCDDSPSSLLTAQYLQSTYRKHLGLDLVIDAQTFKQRLAKMQAGAFDISLAAWYPDYEDPMTFADLFASWNSNNRGRYVSAEYDALLREARASADTATRMATMARIQEIIAEEVVILPDYERTTSFVSGPGLEGVQFKATGGSPIFLYATLREPSSPP